jgi:hypothetical protein
VIRTRQFDHLLHRGVVIVQEARLIRRHCVV